MDDVEFLIYLILLPTAVLALLLYIVTGDLTLLVEVVKAGSVPVYVTGSAILSVSLLFARTYLKR